MDSEQVAKLPSVAPWNFLHQRQITERWFMDISAGNQWTTKSSSVHSPPSHELLALIVQVVSYFAPLVAILLWYSRSTIIVLMNISSNFYSSEGIQNEDHDPWKRKLPKEWLKKTKVLIPFIIIACPLDYCLQEARHRAQCSEHWGQDSHSYRTGDTDSSLPRWRGCLWREVCF